MASLSPDVRVAFTMRRHQPTICTATTSLDMPDPHTGALVVILSPLRLGQPTRRPAGDTRRPPLSRGTLHVSVQYRRGSADSR